MHSVYATFHNGRLELSQPVDWPDGTSVEVIPLPKRTPGSTDALVSWPPRYFEQTAGALGGEEFDRPAQGDFPDRDEW